MNMVNLHDKAITEILPKIGAKNFAVLVVIVKHLGQNNKAFPSIKRISMLTKMGRDAVINSINSLIEFKLISKEQRRLKGKFKSNIYKVKTSYLAVFISAEKAGELKEPCPESPCTESPCTESPCTESPCTESPTESIEQKEVLNPNKNTHTGGNLSKNNSTPILTGAIKKKEKSSAKKEKISLWEVTDLVFSFFNNEGFPEWVRLTSKYKGTEEQKLQEVELFLASALNKYGQHKIESFGLMPQTVIAPMVLWFGDSLTKNRAKKSLQINQNTNKNGYKQANSKLPISKDTLCAVLQSRKEKREAKARNEFFSN